MFIFQAKAKNYLQEVALQELANSKYLPRPPIPTEDTGGRTRPGHLPNMPKPHFRAPPTSHSDRGSLIAETMFPPQLPLSSFPVETIPVLPQPQESEVMTGMLLPPGFPAQLPQSVPQSIFIPFTNLGPPVRRHLYHMALNQLQILFQ